MHEFELIHRLKPLLPANDFVVHGAGDDCAVLDLGDPTAHTLFKTDAVVEGVHFTPDADPEKVGHKAIARCLSDIAAMGGTPLHAMITVAAPAEWTTATWKGLYRGIAKAARSHGISVVGGETVRSPGRAFLSVSLFGTIKKTHLKLRSGAKAGDLICVTGRLGGSFKSGRHLSFHPRLAEGQWLGSRKEVTSMMDLSDGLGSDLPKLATESRCSFWIVEESLPRNRGCSIASAVVDGEDYELLLTIAPDGWPALMSHWKKRFPSLPLTCIGMMTRRDLPPTTLPSGYDHLRPIKS
jgi:thiamine-monophosphate kinase